MNQTLVAPPLQTLQVSDITLMRNATISETDKNYLIVVLNFFIHLQNLGFGHAFNW